MVFESNIVSLKRKSVLIFGPIKDFGGREVEVNIINKALSKSYKTNILSSLYMTEKSFALLNVDNDNWQSIPRLLLRKYFLINLFASLTFLLNKKNNNKTYYLNNKMSRCIYSINHLFLNEIYKQIDKSHFVVACVQLSTKYVSEIVNYCFKASKPCLIRVTGTIFSIKTEYENYIHKVTAFVFHSKVNAQNLVSKCKAPYFIIDQCTLLEDQLLTIPIVFDKTIRYGYLGRLGSEKGILELLTYFKNTSRKLVVAGSGELKDKVKSYISNTKNISYVDSIHYFDLKTFFKQIDVLIIPSFEESGPLVGIEAMSAGKVILSTKVGAMQERLEGTKNNFWFDINDLTTLDNIIREVESSDLESIGQSNRKKYLVAYQQELVESEYRKLIKKYI